MRPQCEIVKKPGGHDLIASSSPLISGLSVFTGKLGTDSCHRFLALCNIGSVGDTISRGADPLNYTIAAHELTATVSGRRRLILLATDGRNTSETWTEDRVEVLKKLWADGLSASQIAGEIGGGVTRNAVIGKVHRLKLAARAKPASPSQRSRTPSRQPRRPGGHSTGTVASMTRRTVQSAPRSAGATALAAGQSLERDIEIAPQMQEIHIPVEQRRSLLVQTQN